MSSKFDDTCDYAIGGMDMNTLWRISCSLNDRELTKVMQAILGGGALKINPEYCKDYLTHETNSDVEN